MRHNMMLSGSGGLASTYFEQDNSIEDSGFQFFSDTNTTQESDGVDGDYLYWAHYSSDDLTSRRSAIVFIEPSESKPIVAGDVFRCSGEVDWYNGSEFNDQLDRFAQTMTIRTYSQEPSPLSDTANSLLLVNESESNVGESLLVSPVGSFSHDFTIATGYTAGIRLYFDFAIDHEYFPPDPPFPDMPLPYIGTRIKNIKLEVISRA